MKIFFDNYINLQYYITVKEFKLVVNAVSIFRAA